MAAIILPRYWNQRPADDTDVDFGRLRGLQFAALTSRTNRVICHHPGRTLAVAGHATNTTYTPSAAGILVRDTYNELVLPLPKVVTGEKSYAFHGIIKSAEVNNKCLSQKAASWWGLLLETGASAYTLRAASRTNSDITTSAIAIPQNMPVTGVVWRDASNIGIQIGQQTATVALSGNADEASSSLYVAGGWPGGAMGFSTFAVFDRALTSGERQAYIENPWQIFKPRKTVVYSFAAAGGSATNLTVADSTHSHAADNTILTSAHGVVVQDSTHAHAADNTVLTSTRLLVVQEATHAHTTDSITLSVSGATTLTVQEASHAHQSDFTFRCYPNSTLISGSWSPSGSLHTELDRWVADEGAEYIFSTTSDDVGLVGLTTNIPTPSKTTGSHMLTVRAFTSAPGAPLYVWLYRQNYSLPIRSLLIGALTADPDTYSIALSSAQMTSFATGLAANDLQIEFIKGSDTEFVAISQAYVEVTNALTSASTLAVQEASSTHAADNVTLVVAGATTLAVADATHAHLADNVTLTSTRLLVAQDATHSHLADNVTLTPVSSGVNLVVADSAHGHLADNVTLSSSGVQPIIVPDSLLAHLADNVILTSRHLLTVQDSLHAHLVDNATLIIPGAFGGFTANDYARANQSTRPALKSDRRGTSQSRRRP